MTWRYIMSSKKERKKINPIKVGDVFPVNKGGTATVVSYKNAKEVVIEFNDKYKYQTTVQAARLRIGMVYNPYNPSVYGVGYLGQGEHCTSLNGENKKVLEWWRGMIYRCYSPDSLRKRPTYEGCEVIESWKCFQNFCSWVKSQSFYGSGYHLDKDLLSGEAKVYSPETCTFLPSEINVALQLGREKRGDLPVGVYERDSGRYRVIVGENGKLVHYGTYDSVEEASAVYVKAKEEYVRSLAEKWKGKIEDRAYQALMNWTVYPKEENQDESR